MTDFDKLKSAMAYLKPSDAYAPWRRQLVGLYVAGCSKEDARAWSRQAISGYGTDPGADKRFDAEWNKIKMEGRANEDYFYKLATDAGWRYKSASRHSRRKIITAQPQKTTEQLEQEKALVQSCQATIKFCTTPERRAQALEFWKSRGFTEEAAQRWNIGFTENGRLFIPYPEADYYVTRSVKIPPNGEKNDNDPKYTNPKDLDKPIFNLPALLNSETVFLTEGQLDAISICESGAQAIAAGEYAQLERSIANREIQTTTILIIPDNDESGEDKTRNWIEYFDEHPGFKVFVYRLPEEIHDCNDYLLKDPAGFKTWIDGAADYIRQEYLKNRLDKRFLQILDSWTDNSNNPVPTGFPTLDEALDGGLYPARLYTLGAVSSIGKSTLALQMASNMAATGTDVLYFALEMTASELTAKILSRMTKEIADNLNKHKNIAWTSGEIATPKHHAQKLDYNGSSTIYDTALSNFMQSGITEHLYIFDSYGNVKVDTTEADYLSVASTVYEHKSLMQARPVVIIDFIQLLSPARENMSDKQAIDNNILQLKNLARTENIPVIIISSFNRENYSKAADLNAFKESGSIEYTSDVIIALQPIGMKEDEKPDTIATNKKLVRDTRGKLERELEARILKNRNGELGRIALLYQAEFNRFIDKGKIKNEDEPAKSEYYSKASRKIQFIIAELLDMAMASGQPLTLADLAVKFKTSPAEILAKCSMAGIKHNGTTVTGIMSIDEYNAAEQNKIQTIKRHRGR